MMRHAPAFLPPCWMWQRRMYRSSLGGGYFEEQLPSSLGASRAKGGISTVHITRTRSKKKVKQRLRIPLTAEGLKAQLRQLAKDTVMYTQRRNDGGVVRIIGSSSHVEENHHVEQRMESEGEESSIGIASKLPPVMEDTVAVAEKEVEVEEEEEEMELSRTALPGSTVLGSDLDLLERDMMREYHQRGKGLPTFDSLYENFGGGCRRKVASFHLAAEDYRLRMARGGCSAVSTAEGTAAAAASRPGVNFCRSLCPQNDMEDVVTLPPEANPHFPIETNEPAASGDDNALQPREQSHTISIGSTANIRTTNTTVSAATAPYDAYRQRPADDRILALRGVDYWDNADNRHRLQQLLDYATEGDAHEMMIEGAMDTSEVGYSTGRVRKETLLYFQAHPINEMIQEPFVRVRNIVPGDGKTEATFHPGDPDTDVDIPASQARRMARELDLDLIRVSAIYTEKSDRRVVAVCIIADHREHMRDMIRFKIQKLGVQPPPTKACIEVPFRGGTHPHAIRFKSIGIAKHLLQGHAVRINLTKFGTPREGFPVFRTILDELARQAQHLHAYHTAGSVRANYNEIYCYLYPSTGRSPKTTIVHPTEEQLDAARDRRILEQEREVYFDDLHNKKKAREWLAYMHSLEKGTAWADKDEGLSLQRQRDIKLMLGYLPKGNRELYAARGDVDIPAPFRASHPTSVERWTHPPESNLEQASRGAAVLGKRLAMNVSEMHDRNETADSPMTVDRFYYRLQGPALEAGELKEALGLKRNRKTLPRRAPGWATLGMAKSPSEEPGYAAK